MQHSNTPTPDDLAGMAWFNDLSDAERSFWLHQADTAVPAEAWAFYKKLHPQSAPSEPRPAGRPRLPAADKLHPVTVKLNDRQRSKLRQVGPDALRSWLDSLDPDSPV
jgi:hypothetical protein